MEKIKFSDLDKEIKIDRCSTPIMVSCSINPDDETEDQIASVQNKFLELPENVKDKLVSHQTSEKIQRIGKHYKLELFQMASVARMIRSYYFGEVKEEDFENILMSEASIDQKSAGEISRYVIERIIKTEIENKGVVAKIVKLSITQAMEKYPKVQDQLISESLIKISGKDDMVKGSVRNWIKDYYAVVGAGNRDVMKRSSYIYHSQNAKALSATEKQKLGFIIKSLDDNSLVTVDSQKEEIIFNVSENSNPATSPAARPAPTARPVPTPAPTNNAPNEKEDIYENKKEEVIFGDRPIKDRGQENISAKINHVQGNRFNLKSDHFEDKNASKSNNMFGERERKEALESKGISNEDNIKFSAPQELPVEKEEKENVKKTGFLRRIRPV